LTLPAAIPRPRIADGLVASRSLAVAEADGRRGTVDDDIGHCPTFAPAGNRPPSSQLPPLPTTQPAPKPSPLAVGQGVVEAFRPDPATPADLPERCDRRASGRKEIKLGVIRRAASVIHASDRRARIIISIIAGFAPPITASKPLAEAGSSERPGAEAGNVRPPGMQISSYEPDERPGSAALISSTARWTIVCE
jgi:hypothetical protein